MKQRLIILTLLTIKSFTIHGQEIKKCDLTIIINKEIGQLTQNDIRDFLLTFDKACANNVEYSEVSNELLFTLIDKQTELTLLTIDTFAKSISIDVILDEITSPLHDGFDLKSLIKKVENTKTNSRLKNKIIDNLKIADSRLN